MRYEDLSNFARISDLIVNRVSVVNQILGARFDGDMSNPARVVGIRGGRRVTLCGEPFCEFRNYDLDSASDAFARVNALCDSLWLLRRGNAIAVCGDFNQHTYI